MSYISVPFEMFSQFNFYRVKPESLLIRAENHLTGEKTTSSGGILDFRLFRAIF